MEPDGGVGQSGDDAAPEGGMTEEPESYEQSEIVPIPAICTNKYRRHEWIDGNGNGAIRAPSLRNCLCFYCGKPLKPHPDYPRVEDAYTKRRRLEATTPKQLALLEVES